MTDKYTWLEINVPQLRQNFLSVKATYPKKQKVGVILKGNAYGHGLLEVTEALHDLTDIIYVTESEDALKIRQFEKKKQLDEIRILVVGPLNENIARELANNNIEFALTDKSFMKWTKNGFAGSTTAKVHIFVDTGLGREGIRWDEINCIEYTKEISNLKIVGIMTHFSDAERQGPPKYAQLQLERFHHSVYEVYTIIDRKDIEVHAAASAPSLLYPDARLDATRLGISLYGYWTSIESKYGSINIHGDKSPDLKSVLTWKAISKNIKLIPRGDHVGYDCAHLCTVDTKIATFSIGYFDGYPCLYNTNAWVLIDGIRCPIIGNVMMNCIVVDISNIDLAGREELEAVLIGKSGSDYIDANTLASWTNSTNYHVLTSIGAHLQRKLIYKEEK